MCYCTHASIVTLVLQTKASPTEVFESGDSNITGRWIIEVDGSTSATYEFDQAPGQATFTGVRFFEGAEAAEPNREIKGRVGDGEITWTEDRKKNHLQTGRINSAYNRITEGQMYHKGELLEHTFAGIQEKRRPPSLPCTCGTRL